MKSTLRRSRPNWCACTRTLSRPGPRARTRPRPLTELIAGLRALVAFYEAHPDWFPKLADPAEASPSPKLDPEWEAALARVYGPEENLTEKNRPKTVKKR